MPEIPSVKCVSNKCVSNKCVRNKWSAKNLTHYNIRRACRTRNIEHHVIRIGISTVSGVVHVSREEIC